MKQKIIAIVSGLAVVGFLGKNQISSFTSKYVTHSDTVEVVATESSAPTEIEAVDTILEKSMKNIVAAGQNDMKSDSLIVVKMEKTVSKIENLNHEVKVLKKENRELRAKLNDTDNIDGHFGLLPIANEALPE
jgi:hypothetical protein